MTSSTIQVPSSAIRVFEAQIIPLVISYIPYNILVACHSVIKKLYISVKQENLILQTKMGGSIAYPRCQEVNLVIKSNCNSLTQFNKTLSF